MVLGDNSAVATLDSGDTSPMGSNTPRAQTPVHEGKTIPSKARLKRIISENSVYEKRPEHRMCWYVHPEVLKSYGQEILPVPCQWNYVTQVPSVAKDEGGNLSGMASPQSTPVSAKRKSTGSMSITKFMKRPRGARQVRGHCARSLVFVPYPHLPESSAKLSVSACILSNLGACTQRFNQSSEIQVPHPPRLHHSPQVLNPLAGIHCTEGY